MHYYCPSPENRGVSIVDCNVTYVAQLTSLHVSHIFVLIRNVTISLYTITEGTVIRNWSGMVFVHELIMKTQHSITDTSKKSAYINLVTM